MALSLVKLLERAVRAHPDRPAVVLAGAGRGLSYRELDRETARVAAALAGLGVQRGDRVGLLLPKSVASLVGIWGVLRSGAAYVPIDPQSPPARAAYMAQNCGMRAVLASGELPEAVAAIREAVPEAAVIQIDGDERLEGEGILSLEEATRSAPGFARRPATPRDLAYVLYTSGSTGTPKGVMLSHLAALSFAEWAAERFAVGPEDVLGNHAPFHFDISTFDVFAAAYGGACVAVLDDETVRFPIACAQRMAEERLTLWYSVPGVLRRMVRAGALDPEGLPALRTLLFAGEAYPVSDLRGLQAALPGRSLVNLYGPTETNVCTYWPVPDLSDWTEPSIPIGFDCEGCQGVVVDDNLRPVPDGAEGELLVRGGTLMSGYWGDPERTEASLVPDFLYPHLGDRLYRTGDLVIRRADGSYAFHGRRDHQIKVRGYRVELAEVEAALALVEGVAEGAVVPFEFEREGVRETDLVAFVVASTGAAPDAKAERALRHSLAARIPKYMIPAEIRWVRSLPMTSTGKLDRGALRARLEPESR